MFDVYLQNEFWFAALQLILAMLGMGATLTLGDFTSVLKAPKAFGVGMLMQIICVPLAAFLFIKGFSLEAGLAAGIAICAAIPGGTISNIFTFFAKGHVPLSISLSGVTTMASLLTTPLILGLLATSYLPENFTMPSAQIAQDIVFYLLIPLCLGMLILKRFPKQAPTLSKICVRLSLLVIVVMVVGAMGAGRVDFESIGFKNVVLINGLIAFLVFISYLIPKINDLKSTEVSAINIEITVRNINLGLLINASLFPAIGGIADPIGNIAFSTLLIYGGSQLIFGTGIVMLAKLNILNLFPVTVASDAQN